MASTELFHIRNSRTPRHLLIPDYCIMGCTMLMLKICNICHPVFLFFCTALYLNLCLYLKL